MTKPQTPRIRRQRKAARRSVTLTHKISPNQLAQLDELASLAGVPRAHLVQWGINNAIKNYKRFHKPSLAQAAKSLRQAVSHSLPREFYEILGLAEEQEESTPPRLRFTQEIRFSIPPEPTSEPFGHPSELLLSLINQPLKKLSE